MVRTTMKWMACLVSAVVISANGRAWAQGWPRVDTLEPGTKIVVTLKTGETRVGHFRRATTDDVTMARKKHDADEDTLSKSLIASIATHDPAGDRVLRGALTGFGALAAFGVVTLNACGIGCEASGNYEGAMALFGAGVGALIGWIADRDAGDADVLYPLSAGPAKPTRTNRLFPGRSTVRVGPTYTHTMFRSAHFDGNAPAPGVAVGVQISPHISIHAEYVATKRKFAGAPVPDVVLQNVVPACCRIAGVTRGTESRRIRYAFSELVGVSVPPWGRVQVEFVGGFVVQAKEERSYYDAYQRLGTGSATDPRRDVKVPGKYYILNFESPTNGVVMGFNTEITMVRGLSIVPMLRYNRFNDSGSAIVYSVGAHWRF